MRGALAAWRLARTLLHGLHGLAIVLLRFPSMDEAARHARIQWWAAGLLRRMGVALHVHGSLTPGAKLLVANHVSWLDIMAIHAVCPQARFVSKADVKAWPLLARLIDSAGTLYIERER
jgi:1-acyl-sn-glycerol-3-phosphate acyltransferase